MPTLAGINGGSLTADIGGGIREGLVNRRLFDQNSAMREDRETALNKQGQLDSLLGQAFPQNGAAEGPMMEPQRAQAQLETQFPQQSQQIAQAQAANFNNASNREKQRIQSVVQGAAELQGLPVDQQVAKLQARRQRLISQNQPTNDTDEHLELLMTGRVEEANSFTNQAVEMGGRLGLLKAPAGQKPTSLIQNIEATGLRRGTPEFQDALKKQLSKPGQTINIGGKAEGKEREELAKVHARRFEKLADSAEAAEVVVANLDQMDAIGGTTGALEPAKAAFAAVVQGFGVDASGIADVTNAQALTAVSNRMVNAVLNAAKGPQTDGDASRARTAIKSLGDDPVAGQFKSDVMRAVALRTIEQSAYIEQQIDDGATFSKARASWNKFKKQTPSLSDVVKNPGSGLPVFFYQFKQNAQRQRPGVTDQQIIEAWRGAHAGK